MADKICSKCNVLFKCESDTFGCWCENLFIELNTLNEIKKQYENCLCPTCLKKYAIKEEKNNC